MYDGATTTVRCAAGLTEEFEVRVGLHQGLALGPFLFAIIPLWTNRQGHQEGSAMGCDVVR